MKRFETVSGVAAPFPRMNVDTDAIIPKQFLKTIERAGLGKGLFYDLRTTTEGAARPDFILNREPYNKAVVLVVGPNFGCGSSREHAVWALLDAGIRVVIGPSFADIFYQNCFKNGLLPVTLPQEQVDVLMQDAERGSVLQANLERQEITRPGGAVYRFEIEPFRKEILLEGLDDIALTLKHFAAIDAFEATQQRETPWLW
jgi:3-isopropylmalate/(R)-2-methylmalate dehydratase small subunit